MFKFLKLPFILLLSSAIMFPAYSSASSGTSNSDNHLQSSPHSFYHFFTNFFNDPTEVNAELNDFIASWNHQDFNDVDWESDEAISSLDIWKKWFCY
ncbi:hypothetical protein [Paenibacillus sp. Soil750]|uniref:hypothetical protein n=1 Tax=Paenibacillus sp. Soil750 TaxID=1736398 RepID=UPI0006F2C7F4|nr:hypothetical protein [Paenibacillus sp. Soil750]KRE75559.1 hypothetical protein ASL11_01645 [Paenibacillus sp. Soil750]